MRTAKEHARSALSTAVLCVHAVSYAQLAPVVLDTAGRRWYIDGTVMKYRFIYDLECER